MDQVMDQQTSGTAGGDVAAGAGAQQQVVQSQQQPGAGTSAATAGQTLYAGKYRTPDELAKAYEELNKRFSQSGEELGRWRQFGQQWDPILKQVGYDPRAAAALLERQARAADQRGDHQQAQDLRQQAAQQKWADAITPQEQEQWLNQYVDGRLNPLQQAIGQHLQQMWGAGQDYINRYMDLAIKAVLAKVENPQLDINKLLQQANDIASGKYDPLEWSKQILLAESPEAVETRIRKKVEEELKQQMANQRATAGVGAMAGGAPARPLRPRTAAAAAAAAAGQQPTAPGRRDSTDFSAAKEQFVGRMAKEYGTSG